MLPSRPGIIKRWIDIGSCDHCGIHLVNQRILENGKRKTKRGKQNVIISMGQFSVRLYPYSRQCHPDDLVTTLRPHLLSHHTGG